ncbi:MAG: sulfotransferase [Proteobacteria bacterium]|nr:sulfotransferase [Pseudomonadota bacterium]
MRTLALMGCPRSGTSWLGQVFNAHPRVAYRYQPLFSYEFKDWFGQHGVTAASVRAFHTALLGAHSDFVLQNLRPAKAGAPSHLVWKEVRYLHLMQPLLETGELDGVIWLYRAPLAVLNSWYQAPREFRAGQDIRVEYLHAPNKNTNPSEYNGLARWKTAMRLALAARTAYPGRVHLLRYERLVAAPAEELARLAAAVDLPVDAAQLAFLTASRSRHDDDAYSVFRAQQAAMLLPPDVAAAITCDTEAAGLLDLADACRQEAPST